MFFLLQLVYLSKIHQKLLEHFDGLKGLVAYDGL
jgi:hypothetical protein